MGVVKYGAICFDDHDDDAMETSGWASIGGGKAFRLKGTHELPTEIIWITDLTYSTFNKKINNPWLRHAEYLTYAQNTLLNHWGIEPEYIDPSQKVKYISGTFARIMRITFHLFELMKQGIKEEDVFVNLTHKSDIAKLLEDPEYPEGEQARIIKQAFQNFTSTPSHLKGGKWFLLSKPKISYAMDIFKAPIPVGPWKFKSLKDLPKNRDGRVKLLRDMVEPVLIEVKINKMDQRIASIFGFGSVGNSEKLQRRWVTQPEFRILIKFSDVDIKSYYVGRTHKTLLDCFHPKIIDYFNDNLVKQSWSAGIVAETLWKAASNAPKAFKGQDKTKKAVTSWRGAWLKSIDRTNMFMAALRLDNMGHAVVSYGGGWVRCIILEEDLNDYVSDGISMGMIPLMSDINDEIKTTKLVNWGGESKSSQNFASMITSGQNGNLWSYDEIGSYPPKSEEREKAKISFINSKKKRAKT